MVLKYREAISTSSSPPFLSSLSCMCMRSVYMHFYVKKTKDSPLHEAPVMSGLTLRRARCMQPYPCFCSGCFRNSNPRHPVSWASHSVYSNVCIASNISFALYSINRLYCPNHEQDSIYLVYISCICSIKLELSIDV
ncbi:hypothetical protein PRUPE_3G086100 [Prunus persica]|uniref:Uncharacterized protein n=1 Tax=Prunus persica TaxID=3760 RepID=A0A251Q0K0_PRUPE|nr:hypothetical protein PRUPE_3G086100 [Prunus persica]